MGLETALLVGSPILKRGHLKFDRTTVLCKDLTLRETGVARSGSDYLCSDPCQLERARLVKYFQSSRSSFSEDRA